MTHLDTNQAAALVDKARAATKTIAIESNQTGAVLTITLNRPESRNAMSVQMVQELRQCLKEAESTAEQPDAVRVVVLRGAGGHFCAGADLKDMATARARAMQMAAPGLGASTAGTQGSTAETAGVVEGATIGHSAADTQASNAAVTLGVEVMAPPPLAALDPVAEVNAAFGQLCVDYARTPLAVVAVLEGTVMGGGFGLACVADVAIASETTTFRLPETSLGVVPAQIAPFLVERLGYSQAKRLAVTGGRLNATQALGLGLVHAAVATADLQVELDKVLADILACAPGALGATKALMAHARLHEPQSMVQQAAKVFSKAAQGAEGIEGITAFMQKRKPSWTVL